MFFGCVFLRELRAMSVMRERLKSDCPDLWHALEQSWQIAMSRWLPMVDALSLPKGHPSRSFNSFPHLKNLETHLDRIVVAYEKYVANSSQPTIVLTLSPVEVYIICAAILFHDMGRITGQEPHGEKTKQILIGSGKFAELGIPTKELATIIADISEFHKATKKTRLYTTAIHPYGTVRCPELAALLVLIDEMDDTFTRVLLESLDLNPEPDFKAEFRRIIREVYLDPGKQTIFTVLDSSVDSESIEFEKILRVLKEKTKTIPLIRNDLARLGIYVNGWRLERDEHLYNEDGKETYECCFYPGCLEELVTQMWDLSTQIFGSASFTYENLAATMREKDIDRIRIAVRRIAIIAKNLSKSKTQNTDIWAGKERWKWPMSWDKKNTHCDYVAPEELKKVLKSGYSKQSQFQQR